MSEHHWIAGAIKHHGAFRAKAKAAGMSTEAFAHKHKSSGGLIGKQANLALTLMGLPHHEKPKPKVTIGSNVDKDHDND